MKLISSSLLSVLLIPALVVAPLTAQSAVAQVPASAVATNPNNDLQLRVVDGDGAEARVNSNASRGLTVQVSDATGAVVPEAAVAVRLPDNGPTGSFADGTHSAVAYTDSTGRAHFTGMHWGQAPGSMTLRITATKGTSHAALLIDQRLVSESATVVEVPTAPVPASTRLTNQAAAPPAQVMANSQRVTPAPAVVPPPPATSLTPDTSTASAAPLGSAPLPSATPAPVVVAQASQPSTPQPGQIRSASSSSTPLVTPAAMPVTASGASGTPSLPAAQPEPKVTVTGAGGEHHVNRTKWIIIAAVVAGAGAGAALALGGKGGTTAAPVNALSIGTPSIAVGHP